MASNLDLTLCCFSNLDLTLCCFSVLLFFVIARILVEERTLQETLPGYVGYMAKVRYRLISFVW